MTAPGPQGAPSAWALPVRGAPSPQIWGLSPLERLLRALARAGCSPIRVAGPSELSAEPGPTLVARADWVYDERLLACLAASPDTLLCSPGPDAAPVAACAAGDRVAEVAAALRRGTAPAGLRRVLPEQLVPAYTKKLRKSEPAWLFAARPELVPEIEARSFSASYKGATDLVTKWVWPRPARAATRRLAAAHVHPNTVTLASWALAVLVCWLFVRGSFGTGLLFAWIMTFLDTVDGKLARVTLTSSRLGDVLDHGLDLVHPPFWWLAWGVGLGWIAEPATWIAVGGYFVGRALEGAFLAAFGMESHCWRPIDTLFRTITARRNPNLILLSVGALAGRPDLGMVMVAIWTLLSLAFHSSRLVQAFAARRRGAAIEPWDARAAPPPPEAQLGHAGAG